MFDLDLTGDIRLSKEKSLHVSQLHIHIHTHILYTVRVFFQMYYYTHKVFYYVIYRYTDHDDTKWCYNNHKYLPIKTLVRKSFSSNDPCL